MRPNIYVSEISSMLNSLAKRDPDWNRPQWTQIVKEGLIGLADTHGCQAYASQCENNGRGEWLYDVTWLQAGRGPQDGLVADSPLVAEIEWSQGEGEIMRDFQKLILARAGTRLMVFESPNPKVAKERIGKMIAQVRAYSRTESGDRYIFACLDNCRSKVEPYNFECQEYIYSRAMTFG